jgi:hypothetical protein
MNTGAYKLTKVTKVYMILVTFIKVCFIENIKHDSVYEIENTTVGIRHSDHVAPSIRTS